MCRICLIDDSTISNPLMSPCNCTGSVAYIHLACLRMWFKSALNSKDENGVICY